MGDLQTNINRRANLFFVYTALVVAGFSLISCGTLFPGAEARDDERQYRKAEELQALMPHQVVADLETDAVAIAEVDDDAADDPAVWINPKDPKESIIFGSNKVGGIHAFDLQGKQLQFAPCGLINNVDVRQEVSWNNKTVDILAGSNRSNNTIDIFLINEQGSIKPKPDYQIGLGAFVPYGFCLYKTEDQKLFAFVNNKDGQVLQIRLNVDAMDNLQSSVERRLKLRTQLEGMVADDLNHILYVGEEEAGIHIFSAKPDGSDRGNLLQGSTKSNKNIRYDIEGLALLPPHYLIASSQGNFSYAIFDLEKQSYITSFSISKDKVDGVQETDGLEVCPVSLGETFPKGILVVQDGFNFDGETKQNQNFKIIDLEKIISLLR
jgi:3-phytase